MAGPPPAGYDPLAMSFIKGHFDGTAVVLDEPATLAVGQAVRVEVVEPMATSEPGVQPGPPARKSLAGFAKGWFVMGDDFKGPLDEFAEYRWLASSSTRNH